MASLVVKKSTVGAFGAKAFIINSSVVASVAIFPARSVAVATTSYVPSGMALAAGITSVHVSFALSVRLPSPSV